MSRSMFCRSLRVLATLACSQEELQVFFLFFKYIATCSLPGQMGNRHVSIFEAERHNASGDVGRKQEGDMLAPVSYCEERFSATRGSPVTGLRLWPKRLAVTDRGREAPLHRATSRRLSRPLDDEGMSYPSGVGLSAFLR